MPEKKTIFSPLLGSVGKSVDAENSPKTIAEIKSYLLSTGKFDNYKKLSLDYESLNPKTLNGQVVVSVFTFQSGGAAAFGRIDPDTEVVMSTQQIGRYDEGEKALPMGKIELKKDIVFPGDEKDANKIIINACQRERLEEITNTPVQADTLLAGSFVDEKTGFVMHVVIEDIVNVSGNQTFSVSLSEEQKREDSNIQLVKLKDLNKVEPISNGIKYSLLIALDAIENQAKFLYGATPTNGQS